MKFKKLSYKLSNTYLPKYGGACCPDGNHLVMSTRNNLNQSRLSLYKFNPMTILDFPSLKFAKTDILANFQAKKLSNSLGQSYPHIFHIKNQKYLVFTDWYRLEGSHQISNRLALASIDCDFNPIEIHIFETGMLSNAGACRIYYQEPYISLYIPILSEPRLNQFPDYYINFAQLYVKPNIDLAYLANSIRNSSFIRILTGYDKTTCFTKVPNTDNSYIFAARNNQTQYSLYFCDLSDDLLINNKAKLFYKQDIDLTYPIIFNTFDRLCLIASSGRYGSDGLVIARL